MPIKNESATQVTTPDVDYSQLVWPANVYKVAVIGELPFTSRGLHDFSTILMGVTLILVGIFMMAGGTIIDALKTSLKGGITVA